MGPNKSNNANMTTVAFKAAPGICWIKHHLLFDYTIATWLSGRALAINGMLNF